MRLVRARETSLRGRRLPLVLATSIVLASATRAGATEPDAPPPGYAPPPAYAPPPGYAPRPGYAPPPPGYPPPPGAYYPPAGSSPSPRPPRAPRRKRTFLLLPYLGAHFHRDSEAITYQPGVRVGSLFGGRINDVFSLNGELTIDASRSNALPAGGGDRDWALQIAFAPTAQIPTGAVEVMIGPKLGVFLGDVQQTRDGFTARSELTGWFAGLSAGLFLPVAARTSLGLLAFYEVRWAADACATLTGSSEICGRPIGDTGAAQVFGLTAAAIF